MDVNPDAVWITWQKHRRSREIAAALNINLVEMDSRGAYGIRHFKLMVHTIRWLLKRRPPVVFVQNPSMILAVIAVCMKPFLRNTVIVDRHTYFFKGVSIDTGRWWAPLFYRLAAFTTRRADLTIVTNEPLREEIARQGGRGFVLPDKLPTLRPATSFPRKRPTAFVVSTFANDEPIFELIDAARTLESEVDFVVSGRYAKFPERDRLLQNLPSNVALTGFIPEQEYIDRFNSADIAVVLTRLEHCLNCGAYEATVLQKPMVLSDTVAIRSYFSAGAVYTRSTAESITAAIRTAINQRDNLKVLATELQGKLASDWVTRFEQLKLAVFADQTPQT